MVTQPFIPVSIDNANFTTFPLPIHHRLSLPVSWPLSPLVFLSGPQSTYVQQQSTNIIIIDALVQLLPAQWTEAQIGCLDNKYPSKVSTYCWRRNVLTLEGYLWAKENPTNTVRKELKVVHRTLPPTFHGLRVNNKMHWWFCGASNRVKTVWGVYTERISLQYYNDCCKYNVGKN